MQHAGQGDIADIPTAPRDQPSVLATTDAGSEQALAHAPVTAIVARLATMTARS